MSKKILCLLGSTHFYGKERSNIEVYNLLKAQEGSQIKVVVNTNTSDELKKYVSNFDTVSTTFPDRSVTKMKYVNYAFASLRLNFKVLFELLFFRPDYVFLNDERVYYDACWPLFLFAKKVIYRIGDEPAFPKLSNYKFNSWIWKNIVLKKTDTFVYISEFIKNRVEATGRNSAADVIIYNYPPHRKEIEESLKKQYSNFDGLTIGYLGQLITEKGVHLFVDAAVELLKKNKKLLFYIAGNLEYSKIYSDKLIQKVKDNACEKHILFLGNIDDVQSFFNHIDVLVTPSLKEEPLGNVIVEAKKYGTPSIIFDSGGMPELISHKMNGYVCETSTAQGIEKGIQYYIQNESMVEIHGKNAKASIKELKIDYFNFKKKWLGVFDFER
ncbi:hypothetical protein LCGC14_0796180 [marine sediment metagenome]|uniref:Glycosyltransferase n=2 Tax=root TaxID=1 RepID=A0A831QR89_9FLAO|nr:glycosyltransferase [Pricia antarctica]